MRWGIALFRLPLVLALSLLWTDLVQAGALWDSADDNKPMVELEAMEERTMAWEAEGLCIKAASLRRFIRSDTVPQLKAAQRYLNTIVSVARKKR